MADIAEKEYMNTSLLPKDKQEGIETQKNWKKNWRKETFNGRVGSNSQVLT